ncbi:hypothetical protein [Pseudoflavonifractor sp. An85]|uniref:hypothetical protein n=1 Tax=Pseudoflavonifractor sp. An85 TaxID=1965661 RepID=UPI000B380DBA|nr:hypothetical protein [Pseudoflavonifractor sp. An85]OUN25549.1 hypothetical protein B5G37_03325 [Pseudoflavonifractor sp. An85]
MKKWITLLLALCLALTMAACGGDDAPQEGQGVAVDVDLTQLSSTLVYAEVYNMATNPQDYVGKTVRMQGNLVYQVVNGQPNPDYLACMISDATACCAQGIEFVLAQPLEEYPALGSMVTVTGVLTSYESSGNTFLRLKEATLEQTA